MRRAKGGAPALTAFALETGLTQRYGFTWNNACEQGRVLTAVPEKLIAVFSSRRVFASVKRLSCAVRSALVTASTHLSSGSGRLAPS